MKPPRERLLLPGERRRPGPIGSGVVFLVAVLLVAGSAVVVVRRQLDAPVREAQLPGLMLRVDDAVWVHDQMDHDGPYAMPQIMTPDLPVRGEQRFSLELTVMNPTAQPQPFRGEELELRSPRGVSWRSELEAPDLVIGPEQAFTTYARFDVASDERDLRLVWARGGEEVKLMTTTPARHVERKRPRPAPWPASASKLPPGDPDSGRELFEGRFACFGCHGRPDTPGSNTLAPHLRGVGEVAARRVVGLSAADYLYTSLLEPNAHLAPACVQGAPCGSPSAMPAYGEVMTQQEMSDLLQYLLNQRG